MSYGKVLKLLRESSVEGLGIHSVFYIVTGEPCCVLGVALFESLGPVGFRQVCRELCSSSDLAEEFRGSLGLTVGELADLVYTNDDFTQPGSEYQAKVARKAHVIAWLERRVTEAAANAG